MKGIVLAGGSGTRLLPITKSISKQLIPIYDKPMIYYPIATLMEAGIKEILIITSPEDMPQLRKLLGNGAQWGLTLEYAIQRSPDGLAQAFIIGEDFLAGDSVAMILGDNMFHGHKISEALRTCTDPDGGIIFGARVQDPQRYGIVEFSNDQHVISIEEKPEHPRSNYAIPGLYFYDNNVVEYAKQVRPSKRGELEIIDIHNAYLRAGKLRVTILDDSDVWLDAGTIESLSDAADFVRVIQKRSGKIIGSPDAIAEELGYLDNRVSTLFVAPRDDRMARHWNDRPSKGVRFSSAKK